MIGIEMRDERCFVVSRELVLPFRWHFRKLSNDLENEAVTVLDAGDDNPAALRIARACLIGSMHQLHYSPPPFHDSS